MLEVQRDSSEIFDSLRQEEERNFSELKELLGETFTIVYGLLRLYDLFLELSMKSVLALEDDTQIPALLHLLQWMKNEAIFGTLTIMRGHITDTSNFSRRSLEVTAFIAKIYGDKEAGKRWMEAGKSASARGRYLSAFPAWQLVKELLNDELKNLYEEDCMSVHPSFYGAALRAEFADRAHTFSYFDLSEEDENQTYFVMRFLSFVATHAKAMAFLTQVFYPSGVFDAEKWMTEFRPFIVRWTALSETWKPKIEERLKKHVDEESAEKKSRKKKVD